MANSPSRRAIRSSNRQARPLDSFLEAIQFDDLRPHSPPPPTAGRRSPLSSARALRHLTPTGNLVLLRIEDYGAKGLVGPEYEDGNYMAVVRNILDSIKRKRWRFIRSRKVGDGACSAIRTSSSSTARCQSPRAPCVKADSSVGLTCPGIDCLTKGKGLHGICRASLVRRVGPDRDGVTRSYWGNKALAADTYLARENGDSGTSSSSSVPMTLTTRSRPSRKCTDSWSRHCDEFWPPWSSAVQANPA